MTLKNVRSEWLCVPLLLMSITVSGWAQSPDTVDKVGKPGSSTSALQQAAKVAALFSEWDKLDSPGCVVGVIQDGAFIYQHGFGMANLEHGVPITRHSALYIASTSKQFIAMAVFLLAAEGKVSLDTDIREYIPELPVYGRPVTIRHLMHHTSGIRDYLMLKQYAGLRHFPNKEETLGLMARQKELNFTPGSRSVYPTFPRLRTPSGHRIRWAARFNRQRPPSP